MWSVTTQREIEAIDELRNNPSDRAIGIVLASFVEGHLTDLIKSCFIKQSEVEREMFHSSGPLGAFSSKIRLAYLMGLIGDECFKNLQTMKEIRNRFAHYPAIGRFDLDEIRSRCMNLTLVEKHVVDADNGIYGDASAIFALEVRGVAAKLRSPKDRYVLAAQVLCIGLQNGASNMKPQAPVL
jgi:DNA-binding MltR family transcriptional regulator